MAFVTILVASPSQTVPWVARGPPLFVLGSFFAVVRSSRIAELQVFCLLCVLSVRCTNVPLFPLHCTDVAYNTPRLHAARV